MARGNPHPNTSPNAKPFKPGNKFGKGNPNLGSLNKFRAKFFEAVTPEHFKALVTLVLKAAFEKQDEWAIKMVFQYALGLPQQFVEVTGKDGQSIFGAKEFVEAVNGNVSINIIEKNADAKDSKTET